MVRPWIAGPSFDCWRRRRSPDSAHADTGTALPRGDALRAGDPARHAGSVPGPGGEGALREVRSTPSADVADAEVVREMMARGMCALTGEATALDAWKRFFVPQDVVGIKVNCGGHPFVVSAPEIVAEVVRSSWRSGSRPRRSTSTSASRTSSTPSTTPRTCPRASRSSPRKRPTGACDNRGYDPATYVEVDFFGEEDTRSNLMRLVSRRLTKIINVPNMKDHGATGRHRLPQEHRLRQLLERGPHPCARASRTPSPSSARWPRSSRCARAPCCRSWTACAGSGTAGPSRRTRRYRLPPAADAVRHRPGRHRPPAPRRHRRQAQGRGCHLDLGPLRRAPRADDAGGRDRDPNVNILIREPGHVEYAAALGPRGLRPRPDRLAGESRCEPRSSSSPRCPASTGRGGRRPLRDCAEAGIDEIVVAPGRSDGLGRAGFRHAPRRDDRSCAARSCRRPASTGARGAGIGHPRALDHGEWLAVRAQGRGRYRYEAPAADAPPGRGRGLCVRRRRGAKDRPSPTWADLGRMLAFLRDAPASGPSRGRGRRRRRRRVFALVSEVMNLMARRNLLFRAVPTPRLRESVAYRRARLEGVPAQDAADPDAFALKVRRTTRRRAEVAPALRQRGGDRPARRRWLARAARPAQLRRTRGGEPARAGARPLRRGRRFRGRARRYADGRLHPDRGRHGVLDPRLGPYAQAVLSTAP